MRYFSMGLMCALVLMLSSYAHADDRFTLLDANNDAAVSWEEFSAVNPNMPKLAFDAIDTNANGSFSPDEWQAFIGTHAKEGMGKPNAKGMGSGMSGMPGMPSMPPQHSSLPATEASPPSPPMVSSPSQPTVAVPVAPVMLMPPSGTMAGTQPAGGIAVPSTPKSPSEPNISAPTVPTPGTASVPNPNDPPQPSAPKSPQPAPKGATFPRVPLLMPPHS